MDDETLLSPVSIDAPAGPDLSYDPGRQAIEQAFASGDDEVEWDRTIVMIEAQARLTRDVWLAVYLARAGARAGDLATVEAGTALLAGLFERFWEEAHPTIEEYGVEGRKGACESLVRIGEFLGPLRRVPLIEHPRLGRFSGGDVELYAAEGAAADGYGQFRAALGDTAPADVAAIVERLAGIRAAIARADAILSEQAERQGQTGTNFQPTYDTLDSIAAALRAFVAVPGDDATAEAEAAPAAGAPVLAASGRVSSREDVSRALQAIIDYYRRAEPSSPVPVALERVKNWVTMDFVAILSDIAPGSLGDVTNVLHTRVQESGGSDMM